MGLDTGDNGVKSLFQLSRNRLGLTVVDSARDLASKLVARDPEEVEKLATRMVQNFAEDYALLSPTVAALREVLFARIPPTMHGVVARAVLEQVSLAYRDALSMREWTCPEGGCAGCYLDQDDDLEDHYIRNARDLYNAHYKKSCGDRVTEGVLLALAAAVVAQPTVTSLDLSNLALLGIPFKGGSHLLTHLGKLKNLVVLVMPNICTNLTVEVLTCTCKMLSEMDIGGSCEVDDEAVPNLTTARELKILNLSSTSVTDHASLLRRLPKLTSVGLSRLDKSLCMLEDSSKSCPQIVDVKCSFEAAWVDNDTVGLLVKTFPSLESVALASRNYIDLSGQFNGLIKLDLAFHIGMSAENVGQLVSVVGAQLVGLALRVDPERRGASELAIVSLATGCRKLKTLNLTVNLVYSIMDKDDSLQRGETFNSLEKLVFNGPTEAASLLVSLAPRLKTLDMSSGFWVMGSEPKTVRGWLRQGLLKEARQIKTFSWCTNEQVLFLPQHRGSVDDVIVERWRACNGQRWALKRRTLREDEEEELREGHRWFYQRVRYSQVPWATLEDRGQPRDARRCCQIT